MKKFIISIFILMSISVTASANVLNCNIYDNQETHYMYHNKAIVISGYKNINHFWWTGKEFLNQVLGKPQFIKSNDLVEWEDVSIEYDLIVKISRMYEPIIRFYGGKYIAYDKAFWNASVSINDIGFDETTIWPMYILDENFNLLEEYQFTDPMTDFDYINGVYYFKTQHYTMSDDKKYEYTNTIYRSDDALNWSIDDTLTEIPRNNGKKNEIMFQGKLTNWRSNQYRFEVDAMKISNSYLGETNVAFENPPTCYYETIDDLYVSCQQGEVKTFRVSLDGVYFIDITIPEYEGTIEGDENIIEPLWWKDKLIIRTTKRLLEYDIAEIRNLLNQNCSLDTPYIKFNNNILSFETPPVIEDGSTLVPMRFLFEQMGADVEWNQATQTAKAKLNNTAVTFSIDNIKASVNNTPTTMDVPARLINDKTMVPLRFLSEEMGFDVKWDDASRTAIIE